MGRKSAGRTPRDSGPTAVGRPRARPRRAGAKWLGAALLLLVGGCQTYPWSAPQARPAQLGATAAPPLQQPGGLETAPQPPVPTLGGPPAQGDPAALQQVMVEVQQLGQYDPALQAKLLAELRQSEPALWPLVVQNFRSRVAYSQQLRGEEALAQAQASPPATPWPAPGAPTIGPPVAPPAGPPAGPNARVARLPVAEDTALPPTTARPAAPSSAASGPREVPGPGPVDEGRAASRAASASAGELTPVSYVAPARGDWRALLGEAISGLEATLAGGPAGSSQTTDAARLRLLRLAAGQRDQAVEPIAGAEAAMADFWSKELFGLDVLLDAQRTPQAQRRASEARRHLAEAMTCLGESASLEVRNLAFCSEVQSYGSIKRFEKYEFAPGQRVLLYAEVENFKSEEGPQGFHTSLASSYQIFDAAGRRVDQQEPKTTEEYCQNPRRDYFLGCDFCLPKQIYSGKHTLKLTVEDQKSHKVGESSIEFTIK